MAARRIPSISFALIEGGRVAQSESFGLADLETGEAADRSTLYEAASLTKPVIALLALRMVDAGLLVLDEPVAATLAAPRVSDRARYGRVTARHLLSHSAGFANWSGDFLDPDRKDAIHFQFEPGSDFSYSGEGYELLGQLLDQRSGKSLEEASDALFAEIGMPNSTLAGARVRSPVARGHFGLRPDRAAHLVEAPAPAWSLMTNALDYGRFLAFVATGGGLRPETLAESRRVHVSVRPTLWRGPRGPEQLGWSLGWGVLQRDDGPVFFQWGDNGAFRAFAAYRVPETGDAQGIVFFVNGSRGLLDTHTLAAPVLGDVSTASRWFSSSALELLRTIVRI